MWMLSASRRSRCVSARTLEIIPASKSEARGLSTHPTPDEWSGVFFDLGLALRFRSFAGRLSVDRIDQRLKAVAIFLPALDRRLVDRLADLGDARRLHRAVGLVELDAFLIPGKAEEFDQALRFLLRVRDHVLVDDRRHEV